VKALGGYTGGSELVGLELRNGDHRVESSEHEALELFVRAVLPVATGKTVYGGYYWHSRLSARMTTHDIRSVTVCMHYVYAASAAELSNERALAKIATPRHEEWRQLHTRVLERSREIPAITGR
jgi:hypothetical protein